MKQLNTITILFILFFLAYIGAFVFGITRKDAIVSRAESLAHLQQDVDEANSLKAVSREIAQGRETIEAYILNDEEVVEFISFIEGLGKGQDLKVTITSVSEQALEDAYYYSIQFSAVGRWAGLYHFGKLLESLPYLSILESVSYKVADTTGSTGWNGTFVLLVKSEENVVAQ